MRRTSSLTLIGRAQAHLPCEHMLGHLAEEPRFGQRSHRSRCGPVSWGVGCAELVDSIALPSMRRERRSDESRSLMSKPLTLLSCILFGVTFLAVAVPQIAVDNDVHEFDSVLDGTPVTHTFVLTNVGDQALNLTEVRSTAKCPCTVHELGTDTLRPGESTELMVTWDTRGYGERGYPGMSFLH
jgi:hypothetical protein